MAKQLKAKQKSTRKRKTVSRRKKTKKRDALAGLNPAKFSRIKQEFHDIDYVNKLSDKDKAWLNNFMEEDLGARMNHDGKKIYRKTKDKREAFRRNNKRNFDIYSNARASGRLLFIDPQEVIEALQQEHYDAHDIENRLIEIIDEKKLKESGE